LKKVRTSAQIAVLLAIFTLISKLLGFFREIFLAGNYGTSYVVDAFSIANSIPSILFAGILGATATTFIPVFSDKMESEGELSANRFTSQLINILILFSLIAALVGVLFSPQLVTALTMPESGMPKEMNGFFEKTGWYLSHIGWFFTHGWTGAKAEIASHFLRVTFAYTLFSTVAGILNSYLRYKGVFLTPVLASYSLNFFAILFIFISARNDDPSLLIYGFLFGQIAHMVLDWIIANKHRFKYVVDFRFTDTVKRILVLAVPVFIGTTVSQINMFVSRALGSGLPEGNIASLDYSWRVMDFIIGLSATIISTILYPKMARAYAQGEHKYFAEIIRQGIVIVTIIGIPFAIGAMLYSDVVIQIIYERGAFGAMSTQLTSKAFFYFSFGMLFTMINAFLIHAFYSRHNTRTPLLTSIWAIPVEIISNIILIRYLGNGGLALGFGIACGLNTLLLTLALRKSDPHIMSKSLVIKLLKVALSAAVSVFATYAFFVIVRDVFAENAWVMPRALLLGVTMALAAALYLLLLKRFKVEEIQHLREIFRSPEAREIE
jgi:putative peptidoglycan lipid II flippase